MRTVLLLGLVLAAAGAATWLLVRDPTGPGAEEGLDTWAPRSPGDLAPGDPAPGDRAPGDRGPVSAPGSESDAEPGSEPAPPAEATPVPTPGPVARVAILAPGEALPPASPEEVRACEERREAFRFGLDARDLSGADLLEAASKVFSVRTRDRRDLLALQQLRVARGDFPGPDVMRFEDLIDIWMREGFEVRIQGAYLVFEDRHREERDREPPPPEVEAPPR